MSKSGKNDYYEVLGLKKADNPDPAALKKAYYKEALKWHPDKNTDDPEATEKFKELNEAYDTLSDPEKRAEYDRGKETLAKIYEKKRDNFKTYVYNQVGTWYADDKLDEYVEGLPVGEGFGWQWDAVNVIKRERKTQVMDRLNTIISNKNDENRENERQKRYDEVSERTVLEALTVPCWRGGIRAEKWNVDDAVDSLSQSFTERYTLHDMKAIIFSESFTDRFMLEGRGIDFHSVLRLQGEAVAKKELFTLLVNVTGVVPLTLHEGVVPLTLHEGEAPGAETEGGVVPLTLHEGDGAGEVAAAFARANGLPDVSRDELTGAILQYAEDVRPRRSAQAKIVADENLRLLNRTLIKILERKGPPPWNVDEAIIDFQQDIADAFNNENTGDDHWFSRDIEKAHEAYYYANRLDPTVDRTVKEKEMKARFESPRFGLECKAYGCKNTYYKGVVSGRSGVGWWTPGNRLIRESKGCRKGCGLVHRRLCPECAKKTGVRGGGTVVDGLIGGKLMRNKRRKTNKKTKKRSKKSKIKSKKKKSKKIKSKKNKSKKIKSKKKKSKKIKSKKNKSKKKVK